MQRSNQKLDTAQRRPLTSNDLNGIIKTAHLKKFNNVAGGGIYSYSSH